MKRDYDVILHRHLKRALELVTIEDATRSVFLNGLVLNILECAEYVFKCRQSYNSPITFSGIPKNYLNSPRRLTSSEWHLLNSFYCSTCKPSD